MKTNRQHNDKGRQVLTKTRNSDKPFVPPRLIVPESQTREDDSEEETQLPKDQPPYIIPPTIDRLTNSDSEGETQLPKDQPPSYIPETGETSKQNNGKDYVPVSSIFLDERTSEDEDDIPVAVVGK